ncbi:MAG: hypothetical protein MUO53_15305 [Maribacter sp.]|nr:hypothetical protein [Maribacter sp.]
MSRTICGLPDARPGRDTGLSRHRRERSLSRILRDYTPNGVLYAGSNPADFIMSRTICGLPDARPGRDTGLSRFLAGVGVYPAYCGATPRWCEFHPDSYRGQIPNLLKYIFGNPENGRRLSRTYHRTPSRLV